MAIKIVRRTYDRLQVDLTEKGWQQTSRDMLPTHAHCLQVADMYPVISGHMQDTGLSKIVRVAHLCKNGVPKYRTILGHA